MSAKVLVALLCEFTRTMLLFVSLKLCRSSRKQANYKPGFNKQICVQLVTIPILNL